MNKLANVKSGELYAIPLFLTEYPDSKSFSKEKFEESDKQFVFCRIIEDLRGGGILIEVFDKTGNLSTKIQDIISAERLIRPITISGVGIYKKRWKKIGEQNNYDKFRDSFYSEITLVAGVGNNLSLWKGGNNMGQINEEEAQSYEPWIVWRSSQVENRVLKYMIEEKKYGFLLKNIRNSKYI
jgi:hypothetical protein